MTRQAIPPELVSEKQLLLFTGQVQPLHVQRILSSYMRAGFEVAQVEQNEEFILFKCVPKTG